MSQTVKYLSNSVRVIEASGEITEYDLSIVTVESEESTIKSYSIRPFLSEEPAVIYLDVPLEIHCKPDGIKTKPQLKK